MTHFILELCSFATSSPSLWWPFIDVLALKIAFPLASGAMYDEGSLSSGICCLIVLVSATTSAWAKPLSNKYFPTAIPLFLIAILAILNQELSLNPLLPIVVTSVVLVLLILMGVGLIITRAPISHEESYQKDQSLVSNSSEVSEEENEVSPLLTSESS